MHYEVDPVDDQRIRREQQQAALNPPGQVKAGGVVIRPCAHVV